MELRNADLTAHSHLQAEKLRQELRALILQSPPGTPLPSENALAYKYKVSRMTARRALKKFAGEALIECRNGVGSFVKGSRTITLLVPCPEFFDDKFYPYNQVYYRYFQGVLQAVTGRGMNLKTIAVSPTNNRDHIQYSLLNEINAGSMVVCSVWFNRLYELLASKGARVAILGMQYEDYGYQQYHKQFYTVSADSRKAFRTVLDYYYARGKRRIAVEAPAYTKSNNILYEVYSAWCREHHHPVLNYSYPELDSTLVSYPKGLFRELYRKDHFDTMIFSHLSIDGAHGTIHGFFDLPPEVDIFGYKFCGDFNPNLAPVPSCFAPCREMAYEAVKILDEAPPRGTERMLDFEFHNLPADWEACLKEITHPKVFSSNPQTKEN